jgi:hypothetical protein
MTSFARAMMAAVILVAAAGGSAAQTPDEVVERHLKALGGRAALEKLISRTMIGSLALMTPVGDLNGPIEVTTAVPNKSRILIGFDLTAAGGRKELYDERFDGSSGYIVNTMDGNRDISGNHLHSLRNETFPTPLLDYRRQGASLALAGKETIGDRETYVLVLTPKTGPAMKRYIDAASYLEIRTVTASDDPAVGAFEMTTDLSDYREVDGVKVPFQVSGTSTARNFVATITSVTHNQKIDAAVFSKPAQ